MVINIKLNPDDRPIFKAMLNGIPINVILDTGAQCSVFTGSSKYLELCKLHNTGKSCMISGFGGNGINCPVYTGTITIVQNGRLLKFDSVEILAHELKNQNNFQLVLPVTLFKLFDIRLYSNDDRRFLEIDTHRDDKITYKTIHRDNGAISEVLCSTSFSVMKSFL